ncbi:hypothetical protein [Vibrio variabilis]|uniref:hypothetical protein n=1 Tax=Vibrio variabilis TaxID=990271 RepID=UPI000DD5748A|nr:hypothetical protein [Vibrio variabilis]
MKRLLLILPLLPFPSLANDALVKSIERFTDIFSISFSKVEETTVATLDANYKITDNFRIFGDVDTLINWEAGAGYSFWQGEDYYTENTLKFSEYKVAMGIFAAKLLYDNWTLIGDVNYNHNFDQEPCLAALCWQSSLSDSIKYSAGVLWSPIKHADILIKYNQEVGIKQNTYSFNRDEIPNLSDRTNEKYYEIITLINMKYLKPTVTYTRFPEA